MRQPAACDTFNLYSLSYGDYRRVCLSRFSYLNRDELQFVETFIRVQGNIKEMEKEFNISYPTVKKMLDMIITKMGFPVRQEEKSAVCADDVLSRLQQGEISAEEAIALLKK